MVKLDELWNIHSLFSTFVLYKNTYVYFNWHQFYLMIYLNWLKYFSSKFPYLLNSSQFQWQYLIITLVCVLTTQECSFMSLGCVRLCSRQLIAWHNNSWHPRQVPVHLYNTMGPCMYARLISNIVLWHDTGKDVF